MEKAIRIVDKALLSKGWVRVDGKCKQAQDDGHPMRVWQFNLEGHQAFELQLTEPQPTFAAGEKPILILYFDSDFLRILINVEDKLEEALHIITEHQDKTAQFMKQGKGNELMEEICRPLGVALPTRVFVELKETGALGRTMVMNS